MPPANYGYEKRQREEAKKRKKQDKLLEKAARQARGPSEGAPAEPQPPAAGPEGTAPQGPETA